MFENVGRDPDKEAGKRRALSLGLTLLIGAGGVGFSIGMAAYTAAKVVPQILEDLEMVEIVMEDEAVEEAPPPPPPPPAAAPDEEVDEDAEPDTDEMDEEVQELDKEPEDKVADAKGVPPGDPDGQVGGVIGGVAGGVVGGTGAGVHVMHHSEVEVKKSVQPEYPKAAKEANLGDQRCLAKVKIDEEGTPYEVRVENCPNVFHAATQEAILKWRWYPPKVGKEKVKAQITIAVNYKMR